MDYEPIRLSPKDILFERPFTHPNHIASDLPVLQHVLLRLCQYLETRMRLTKHFEPELNPEDDGRYHRFLIPRPVALSQAGPIAVVGFFGQKREGADPDHFGNLGHMLVEEIPSYNEILSYNTMELPSGNFSNLVLLTGEAVKEKWRMGTTHLKAIDQSPGYYNSIRIYNGQLDKISAPESLKLIRVKYWDFNSQPTWHGIRSLG